MKFLSYEQFGALGDGIHDDLPAIVACHEEANKTGTPVKTKDGAKYYIGGKNITAVVKTDVDFGKSEFIIDDRELENIKSIVFLIASDYEPYEIDIKAPFSKESKIALPHPGKAYIRIFNSNQKRFMRKGLNENNGFDTSDVFIVDEMGNVTTDIDWDYPEVTQATARRFDERPISVRGGIFTTIANQLPSTYRYHKRGISIQRDGTTIENITHYVTGEGDHGAPYNEFIDVTGCADVTVRNCLLTPHFIYKTPSKVPGKDVQMGTYDINVHSSIRTKFIGIRQTIDIMDTRYWGLMGSNFCKEMYFEDCIMSRFDAHMGVTHATIKNCRLGHQCLNLIGHGTFVLEDTYLLGRSLIGLRGDYGSIWDGDIFIKNCEWKPMSATATVFRGENCGDHDFGYTCYMPHNVVIDGLKVLDGDFDIKDEKLYYLFDYDKNFEEGKPYPYIPTKTLTVSNIETESGRKILPCPNPALYKSLEFIEK